MWSYARLTQVAKKLGGPAGFVISLLGTALAAGITLGVVGKTAVDKLAEEEKNNQIDDVPQRTTIDVQSTGELGNDPIASMDETDD